MNPVVIWRGSNDESAALVVLLHGRGANEREIVGLADVLPIGPTYAAVRGPIDLGGDGYAWFENQGIGRPRAESLRTELDWFWAWLDEVAGDRRVVVVGFSGGGAFAGALALDRPDRLAGVAVLYGTMPFDAGLSTDPDRLDGLAVFHAQAIGDTVIPRDLLNRTWSYLSGDAGALAVTHRHTGGHEISPTILPSLGRWILNRNVAS